MPNNTFSGDGWFLQLLENRLDLTFFKRYRILRGFLAELVLPLYGCAASAPIAGGAWLRSKKGGE